MDGAIVILLCVAIALLYWEMHLEEKKQTKRKSRRKNRWP